MHLLILNPIINQVMNQVDNCVYRVISRRAGACQKDFGWRCARGKPHSMTAGRFNMPGC
jgi:hypothetical protein